MGTKRLWFIASLGIGFLLFLQPLTVDRGLSSTNYCLENWHRLIKRDSWPAHSAITTDLFRGRFIEGHPVTINGNKQALWKVKVYNEQTGRYRDAFFKPRQYGDADGWGRVPMEYVAYALNRKLGMDYVPPTAYRRWVTVGGEFFNEGALIYAVPEAGILYDTDSSHWNAPAEGVTSDHRILSVLLQNPDGHYKNLLIGKHWVNGERYPVFIDFGASLRHGTSVNMTHYPAFRNSSPVEKVRRKTLEHLKKLHWNDLREMKEFISDDEMRGILSRRDGIVRYFEHLISERGEQNVIIEE